jgi:hypothetical protein
MLSRFVFLAGCLLLLVKVQGTIFLAGGRGVVKLALYKEDRTTLIGTMASNMVLDLAKNPRVNIKASAKSALQSLRVSSMAFKNKQMAH